MADLHILIVADHLLARAGLAALLANQPGCTVVGQVSDTGLIGDALLVELDVYRPDVLLYDLGWNPVSALRRLAGLVTTLNGDLPVLALLPDDQHAIDAAIAFRLEGGTTGAGGIMLHKSPPEALVAALNAVAGGLFVIDPALMTAMIPSSENVDPELPVEALTPREQEVLQLLAEGLPNKIIAARLNISEHTVKFHVNALLTKLGAQSRTEAVVRATRLGLIIL